MFIRAVRKQNRGSTQVYHYHQLIEAVRTPKGPRQRILLNLGTLEVPQEEWKNLANRIEELYLGRPQLLPPPTHLEQLAQHYARLLRQQQLAGVEAEAEEAAPPQWETVDLGSVTTGECRTLGGEAVALMAFEQLGFPAMLADLGLSPAQVRQAALLIIGRLLHPASERETARWAQETSALGEMLDARFHLLSNNALYRLSDRLAAHRQEIEARPNRPGALLPGRKDHPLRPHQHLSHRRGPAQRPGPAGAFQGKTHRLPALDPGPGAG